VFEGIALHALKQHEADPEFQRLLLHSALEGHELAQMFWEKFVKRVYHSLGAYVRERQRDGAMIDIAPALVVRAFIGMVVHHSLNNKLWDRQRRLVRISKERAAREFAKILLRGNLKTPKNGQKKRKNKIILQKISVPFRWRG